MDPRLRLHHVIADKPGWSSADARAMDTERDKGFMYAPGEVLVLLTPVDDLQAGLYVVHSVLGNWAVLRGVVDQEETETLWVTEQETTLPFRALDLFMPVGINLRSPS
jgi:hypothetical protein